MTPTPSPTAEPLKSWEVNSNAWEAFEAEEHMTNGIQAAYEAGLRAHGLLSEGAPGEKQIARMRRMLRPFGLGDACTDRDLRQALTAAGVAPREPSEKCTCPSGDGSLRWPCPSPPPVSSPAREKLIADDDLPDEHLPNRAYKVGRKIAERGDFNGLDAATVFMRGAVYGVRKLAAPQPLDPAVRHRIGRRILDTDRAEFTSRYELHEEAPDA